MSAGEALGHGATARAFGSYGGARAGAQSGELGVVAVAVGFFSLLVGYC